MPIDSADFRRALGQFASGVTVVTTRTPDGHPLGLTVSAFSSLSLDPPLVLACIDKRSESTAAAQASGVFGVSLLAEDQEDVSQRFAAHEGDRFAGLAPGGGAGLVLIPGALAQLECRLHACHDAGDHVIWIGLVEAAAVRPGRPLLYHDRGYRRLAREEA
jgi:flavin reductase (DIM6/NTAB) family NADH-FMN oxidoreductase RutF